MSGKLWKFHATINDSFDICVTRPWLTQMASRRRGTSPPVGYGPGLSSQYVGAGDDRSACIGGKTNCIIVTLAGAH